MIVGTYAISTDFNPRLREGGDDKDGVEHEVKKISIHASAKEATALNIERDKKVEDFNPRLREGGDAFFAASASAFLNFNPRLREGGDL